MPNRNVTLHVRMTAAEYSLVEGLAEAFGMSISDVIRQLVRREHETRIAPAAKKPKAKGGK